MIGSLQSLRFVFAAMIFLHHFTVNGEGLFYAGGPCGVSFFMILSGFVISAGYSKKVFDSSFKGKEFLLKRLIRLYPLHLLCLFGFLILNISHLSTVDYSKLVPNILLLQSWIPLMKVYFSGNAVSWCLADMMFFYAMFPLLAKLLKGIRLRKMYLYFIFLLAAYFIIMTFLPDAYCHSLLYISPAFRIIDFLFGMLIYKVWQELKNEGWENRIIAWSYIKKSFIEILLILFLIIGITLVSYLEPRYYFAALWWLLMPQLILYFALVNKSGGVISSILRVKWMLALGEISFSVYMIHQMAIGVLHSVFSKLELNMVWQVELVISFLIILSVGYLVFHYYETPVSRYLKKKLI